MKKYLIIIEDDTTAIDLFVMVIGRMLAVIGYETIVLTSIAAVRDQFPNGIPKDALILLDGNLGKEQTTKIFDLFSETAKARTIVTSLDEKFKKEAADQGFKHFMKKSEAKQIAKDWHLRLAA